MPSLPFTPSSACDQGVEDSDEMVYKRVRDDGVSKKDKLRTNSIRARLAAIPSRSMGDGSIVMQIKGRAAATASSRTSRRMEDAGQQSTGSSIVDRAENRSYTSPSNSSKTVSRRKIVSTKASLGNLYPPLSPSNTLSDLKSNSQESSPTDIGPRCSTPSQQRVSACPPALVEAPTSVAPDASHTSTSILQRPLEAAMAPVIANTATVCVFDPFGDDEDDDAMRRLCGSPVLRPNNSTAPSIQNLMPVNDALPCSLPSKRSSKARRKEHQQGQTSVEDAKDSATTASLKGYDVLQPSASASTWRSTPVTIQAMRPDQPVNHSPPVPDSAEGSAKLDYASPESSFRANSTDSKPEYKQTASPAAMHEPALATPSHKQQGDTLSDHIAVLEAVFGDTQQYASPPLEAPVAVNQTARRPAPFHDECIKFTRAGGETKTGNLDDTIALLESLLLGSEPSSGSSESNHNAPLQATPPFEAHQVGREPMQEKITENEILSAPSDSPTTRTLPHLNERQALPHRRASSASSQSFEPASPARSTTPEFEEFAPGEFVVSADTLHDSVVQSRAFQFTIQSEAAKVKQEEPKDDEEDDRPADIPHLNARELPPNMPVPAMNHHSTMSSRFNAYSEPARAQPIPPTLRHPQPRRGTSTPTAFMLEKTAAMRSAQAAVDLSIEYEEEPVDIAARNVKPRRESTTKVKFAENEDEQLKEDDEEQTSDSGSDSDSPYPSMASPVPKRSTSSIKTKDPVPLFEFVETDILKGLSMPSLARRTSYASSDTSDSDSQPESPAGNSPIIASIGKKPTVMEEQLTSPAKQTATSTPAPPTSTVARPSSEASSRSASPAGLSDTSDSSSSNGGRDGIRAASKMSAPPIRVGGSLMKKEGRKAGHYALSAQGSSNRYGMHSGYSGPKRNFRTYESPEHIVADSGWRGNDGAPIRQTAVHPETAYDVAQMSGGNVALASFLENYETSFEREMSSKADLLVPEPEYKSKSKSSDNAIGSREILQNVQDRSELEIFDDLLL